MPIEITARHTEVTQPLQNYAREKAEQLVESFPLVEHVHVILDVEKRNKKAEVVVQAKTHVRTEAAEQAEQFGVAIDSAMDKIERQLRRHIDKLQDHKPAMKHEELKRERGMPE